MCHSEQILEAHSTKQQLYGHLSSITKTIQERYTRYAGLSEKSEDKFISDNLLWLTSKNSYSPAQCIHWMLFKRSTKSDTQLGQIARERERERERESKEPLL